MKYFFVLVLLVLESCAPASLSELQCEAEAEIKKLTGELRKLESMEDIQNASKRLKTRFNRIAELLIEARNFPEENSPERLSLGEELFAELARIYEIPGARSVIENVQSEAVRRLDR
ncbi:MAG TPA: hypothetical protein VLE95_08055 [Chlamydiales bacterium]|nr:hypothetical protein [Chlamydiales bacterium]